MEILDGKALAQQIKESVRERAKNLAKKPCLACVVVNGDSASDIYVRQKEKACAEFGLESRVVRLKQNVTQNELERTIWSLNKDHSVDAILVQLPLPKPLDAQRAIGLISPEKDADALTPINLGMLFAGWSNFAPCTASGIIKLLDRYKIEIDGKHAVVVGRSMLVGRSSATMLEKRNATVTLCHSHTRDLPSITRQADILVVAIGKDRYITPDYVKDGAVVIDVGMNRDQNGKLHGDVDFENVAPKCSYITPVPGGVGPLTVACLLDNTVTLAEFAQARHKTEVEAN